MLGMAFPSRQLAEDHVFEIPELPDSLSGVVGPGITVDSPNGVFRLADFRSGSTVLYSKVMYREIITDRERMTEVRLLVRTHASDAGGTTFIYQMMGGNLAT